MSVNVSGKKFCKGNCQNFCFQGVTKHSRDSYKKYHLITSGIIMLSYCPFHFGGQLSYWGTFCMWKLSHWSPKMKTFHRLTCLSASCPVSSFSVLLFFAWRWSGVGHNFEVNGTLREEVFGPRCVFFGWEREPFVFQGRDPPMWDGFSGKRLASWEEKEREAQWGITLISSTKGKRDKRSNSSCSLGQEEKERVLRKFEYPQSHILLPDKTG